MGLHCPFGHLKYKWWPKEGPGVKLAIWLLTTKNRELTRFPCVQMACDISLESTRRRLQFHFRPHLHRKSARNVMVPQSCGNPNFGNFKTPTWESWDQNHLDVGPMERCRIYDKEEGGGFPQVQAVVSLVCPSCPWLVLAPKVLQLCTNYFVLVLCRPVWVSKACQIFLVPFRSSSMPLYPSKVLWAKERALTPCSSAFFFPFGTHIWVLQGIGNASLPNILAKKTKKL